MLGDLVQTDVKLDLTDLVKGSHFLRNSPKHLLCENGELQITIKVLDFE